MSLLSLAGCQMSTSELKWSTIFTFGYPKGKTNMGMVLSTILSVFALLAIGVANAYSAAKSKKCKDAQRVSIISSISAFTIAIVSLVIAIFLL